MYGGGNSKPFHSIYSRIRDESQSPKTTSSSDFSSLSARMFARITAVYFGSKKKGDENLSMPMSRTRCFVAFSLKLVMRAKVSPKLTTSIFFCGLIDLYSLSISTCRPGYIRVLRMVRKPESECSGVVNFLSFSSNLDESTTPVALGKICMAL